MIFKSYEVQRKGSELLKNNLFLLYGENFGLKKDIKKYISKILKEKKNNIEILSVYENEILDNRENFYNLVYAGSLFSNTRIITIFEATDKIVETITNIYNKYPEAYFLYNLNLTLILVKHRYCYLYHLLLKL